MMGQRISIAELGLGPLTLGVSVFEDLEDMKFGFPSDWLFFFKF